MSNVPKEEWAVLQYALLKVIREKLAAVGVGDFAMRMLVNELLIAVEKWPDTYVLPSNEGSDSDE